MEHLLHLQAGKLWKPLAWGQICLQPQARAACWAAKSLAGSFVQLQAGVGGSCPSQLAGLPCRQARTRSGKGKDRAAHEVQHCDTWV